MTGHEFTFCGRTLVALPSGALWAPDAGIVAVSDLHLGKSGRIARREGRLTPPYETVETLTRLADVIAFTRPRTLICLGDSFDDDQAAADLSEAARRDLALLMAGRRWVWIAGNHDPAPTDLGGAHLAELKDGALVFRHIAEPGASGEISGHYHPKVQMRGRRPCFLKDDHKVILPAFGVYTGGLNVADPVFDTLVDPGALALMTGRSVVPAPRAAFR